MKKIINKLGKSSSYLRKAVKKKRRDEELSDLVKLIDPGAMADLKNDAAYIQSVRQFNNKYLGGYKSTGWNTALAAINGQQSEKYIPEDIWVNQIEPRLNNTSHVYAYEDKNIYDLLFPDIKQPKTCFRYSHGRVLDKQFNVLERQAFRRRLDQISGTVILKPSFYKTGRGRGIRIYKPEDRAELFDLLVNDSGKKLPDFIAQEFVPVHDVLKELNPHSINVHKIITLRIHSEIKFLMARLRIAKEKNFNEMNGYSIAIDRDGRLADEALDSVLRRHSVHEDTGMRYGDVRLPGFQKSIDICKKAHQRLLHFDMVTWDLTIDEDGEPVLIEFNIHSQGVAWFQMVNGPLFGKYTDEVLGRFNMNLYFNI